MITSARGAGLPAFLTGPGGGVGGVGLCSKAPTSHTQGVGAGRRWRNSVLDYCADRRNRLTIPSSRY